MPGGVPKYVRVYDNGSHYESFCRKCFEFSSGGGARCPVKECGHRLLPAGKGTFDRYTVVFTGRFKGRCGRAHYVGMSCHPFHPQGFGQPGEAELNFDAPGGFPPKIGDKARWGDGDSRRIPYQLLPDDCQKLVRSDYMEIWGIDPFIQTKLHIEKHQ